MSQKQATMEELVSHMFIMGRLMRDKMQRTAGIGQCTMLEFETLKYVKDVGKPHMREIAKNFHVTPPAATLMIDGLVKLKLLARVLDPQTGARCVWRSLQKESSFWNGGSLPKYGR